MIHATACKVITSVPPAAIIDDGSALFTEVDTNGFDYAVIYVTLGATDIAMTALTVTESATAGSGHANVTGLIWGTSANTAGSTSTLPIATNDNKIFIFEIDLSTRKRYLDATITYDDGTVGGFVSATTHLFKAKILPTSAAERGATEILRV